MRRMAMAIVWAAALGAMAAPAAGQGEIGYVEDFALADDRAAALQKLVPGTEDYYYYHCLHYQNTGQRARLEEMLKLWIKRRGRTAGVREIENRQALLDYRRNPQETLQYLRDRLNLRFDHKQERDTARRPDLPVRLDPALLARDRLTAEALRRHRHTSDGFEDRALAELLQRKDLDPLVRRHALRRLRRPDVENLPRIVVDDLSHEHSRGFGSMPIHHALLKDQLDACLRLRPALRNETRFVQIYLRKLHPNPDVDWQHDPEAKRAYLERLWAFVSGLAPAHNSLKAHVLYRRLVFDRSQGVYDRDRFLTYLKLPRQVPYIRPEYVQPVRQRHPDHIANLGADFRQHTLLPPIHTDWPLVRSYLMHFFVEADSIQPFDTYIRDTQLKPVFAETKIVHGLGDLEQWASDLSPGAFQRLKERVDLDFDHANPEQFGPDEKVTLDVHVKNVRTLLVKVYKLNAFNYYRDQLQEAGTGIDLDGLVANQEKTFTYDDTPPLRRVTRTFSQDDFPLLKDRGLYIIDFIGNGVNSRALVRKGTLRYLERTSTAGHVFTVLDEANRKVPKAAIWLAGRRYEADEAGEIVVPYSTKPGRQPIILLDGEIAALDHFQHEAENYALDAGIHVDREALLPRQTAEVALRPVLKINGEPATLAVLEDIRLAITSTDVDGVSSTREVADLKVQADRETVQEFRVPQRAVEITFTLRAKVHSLTRDEKVDLADSQTFRLNGIDKTEKVHDLHLLRADGGYVLELRGKTGEPRSALPVHLTVKHRAFRDPVHATLRSDENGQVHLGELDDIAHVTARGPAGTQHTWHLPTPEHSYPPAVHARAGETVHVPYMGEAEKPRRDELSLLELRGGTFVADRFEHLAIRDGFVVIGKLPRGDYELLLKDRGVRIAIHVAAGREGLGYVLGDARHLEVRDAAPLQITSIEAGDDAVRIRLANATDTARVHVVATRYLPEYPLFADLHVGRPGPRSVGVAAVLNQYEAGRRIGDEYRYILDRRGATKFPGNMLRRPSLLLNPWSPRKTEAGRQVAQKGRSFGGKGADKAAGRRAPTEKARRAGPAGGFANLDFLPEQSAVLLNLTPDKDGVVTVQRKDLGERQHVHVLAVDPANTAYRAATLALQPLKPLDLRLRVGLDPAKHYAEQKQIDVLAKGEAFTLRDVHSGAFEVYDSLAKVYGLYVTLSGQNADLVEFGKLLNWPKLKDEEKRELYSKYACHEMHFFLLRKDPAFFRDVVRPYLQNKKDKTFLDRWLVGEDVSGYVQPWRHERLNTAERVLLGRRIDGELDATRRHVRELWELLPPDPDRWNHLFATALKARALEAGARVAGALDELRELQTQGLRLRGDVARPSGLGEGRADRLRRRAEAKKAKDAARAAPAEEAEAPAAPMADDANGRADRGRATKEALAFDAAWEVRRRKAVRRLYRKLEKTKEWVENNYYHLPIDQHTYERVPVNAFWRDWAAADPDAPFVSKNLADSSRNLTDMLLALAALDLPFEAPQHETKVADGALTLTAGGPAVVYHRQILPAERAADTRLLVSQNFFRHGDRYRHVDNERLDKFVTDEFLVHVVYGGQVVVTNPTSAPQKLEVLLQVPQGALPVLGGRRTRSVPLRLEPYHTQSVEYYFYFPAAGDWKHYPVHVAKDGKVVAAAEPFTFHVVQELSKVDKESWDWISQNGTDEQVLTFLRTHNLGRIDLGRIAWRMKNAKLFRAVTELLARRHAYHQVLWSYGVRHNRPEAIREYLRHANAFVAQCGLYLDSPLLTIDPIERRSYEHREYWPLVNARRHQLGRRRHIVNARVHEQYHRLLTVLRYRPKLNDADRMSVVYYLLLQDRVAEALEHFGRVKPENLPTRLQYDYAKAYMAFYTGDVAAAERIASRPAYAEHAVDRWRERFAAVRKQAAEIRGEAQPELPAEAEPDDRGQQQTALAATAPSFEFVVENRRVRLDYQNLEAVRVNYYRMDIELLFSRNPFMGSGQAAERFSYIEPNHTAVVNLPKDARQHTFALPEQFHDTNVLVEIVAAGQRKAQPYYSHSLSVQMIEPYGQVQVARAQDGKPLAKVYVKVYARLAGGETRFYKDGYTDLRGRFDYSSLNTEELDAVERFAVLVLSEDRGAVVREAAPPKQ